MRELLAQDLRRLGKTDFERFCRRLLDEEYVKCFAGGDVDLDGPAAGDHEDGGHDLWARVNNVAHKRPHFGLLPDQPVEVWYSCKSSRDDGREKPGGWRKQVLDNLDPGTRILNGKTCELRPDADEIVARENKRSPPQRLLELLNADGRYVVLLNVTAEKGVELESGLRSLFEYWIRKTSGVQKALNAQAVRVLDANHLVRVFNERSFCLPHDLEQLVGLSEPQFLLDWQQWTKSYTPQRRLLTWRPDEQRQALTGKLSAFLGSTGIKPKFRLWGPPGVGKTRLVYEALKAAGVRDRVRFSEQPQEVQRWLRSAPGFARDLVLVVDEVSAIDAATLARDFDAQAPDTAKLIILGPLELGHEGQPTPELLDRLDDAHMHEILAVEMADNDARIEHAIELCGGYPLFAFWLGQALASDPGLLANPGATLTAGDDPWDAACAVLVGVRGANEQAWRDHATRRAKSILLASLTTGVAWSRLGEDDRGAFADALDLGWAELEEAARGCEERSLLRLHGDSDRQLRYVSPANLERLILNYFFGDRPGGPRLDPGRLARKLPKFFTTLGERAALVHASDVCKRNLAQAVLREFEAAARSGDSAGLRDLAPLLVSASHAVPEDSLKVIDGVVRVLGVNAVVAGPLSGPLRQSLVHISHRRISASSFERVEALLFAWARCDEPEFYARADWGVLFQPRLHLTHQPFELRFELLRRYLGSEELLERELAVAALAAGIGLGQVSWSEWDVVDGPWEHEQVADLDVNARLDRLWSAALDASVDPAESVSGVARMAIIKHLLRGLRLGLTPSHLERLVALSASWSMDERDRLAADLDHFIHYDLEEIREHGSLVQAVVRVREAVQPSSLQERLVAQVGRWHPGPYPVERDPDEQDPGWERLVELHRQEQARDNELARELVAEPTILAAMFSWLTSAKAVRSLRFARALGSEDQTQSLLRTLLENSHDLPQHHFTAAYLAGWHAAVGDEAFDHWLDHRATSESPILVAWALTNVPGNEHRVARLLTLLRAYEIPGAALVGIGFSAWATDIPTVQIDELLVVLARRQDEQSAREAIGLLETRLQRGVDDLAQDTRAAAHVLLERQSGSLPAIVARGWSHSVVALAQHGDLEPLLRAVKQASDTPVYPHHLVDAARMLARERLGQHVWPSLDELQTRDESTRSIIDILVTDARLLEQRPTG